MVLFKMMKIKLFFIASSQQINPHAPKEECEYYLNNKLIYGVEKHFG